MDYIRLGLLIMLFFGCDCFIKGSQVSGPSFRTAYWDPGPKYQLKGTKFYETYTIYFISHYPSYLIRHRQSLHRQRTYFFAYHTGNNKR